MFSEPLQFTLTLTIDGTATTISSGNVKRVALESYVWGYDAEVEFGRTDDADYGGTQSDDLFDSFTGKTLIQVSLQISSSYVEVTEETPPDPIVLAGLVTEKRVREISYQRMEGQAVLHRVYTVRFSDAARVLWRQHRPIELFTDATTVKTVLEGYQGDHITFTSDWEQLEAEYDLLLLPGASLYDFVWWYVDDQRGVLTYDATNDEYAFSGAKDTESDPVTLDRRDVAEIEFVFPETIRHDTYVKNAYSEDPQDQAIEQDQAATGIRRDVLVRTEIADEFTARQTLETDRLQASEHEVALELGRWPTVTFLPGTLVTMEGGLWPTNGFQVGNTYRLVHVSLEAVAHEEGEDAGRDDTKAAYEVRLAARLEHQDEPHPRHPPFAAPRWPVELEGKVVSEQGSDTEETWDTYEEEDTSLERWKVKIPLFADQTVLVPKEPTFVPGHFYFPPYLDERVLVAFELDRARIVRYLDWREGASCTEEAQGNRILLGKDDESSCTSITHDYQDGSPVLDIERTNSTDYGLIQMKEGYLLIQVKENEDSSGSSSE